MWGYCWEFLPARSAVEVRAEEAADPPVMGAANRARILRGISREGLRDALAPGAFHQVRELRSAGAAPSFVAGRGRAAFPRCSFLPLGTPMAA